MATTAAQRQSPALVAAIAPAYPCYQRGVRCAPWLVVATLAASGCDLVRDPVTLDAAPPPDGPRVPQDDLVPAIGSATTLDVAAWNIENFPKSPRSIELAADLITSLDLDLVMVSEVASVAAWDELVALLPEHDGVLSSHRYTATSYQKLGLLYRTSLVTVGTPELLFGSDSYAFPRPAFKVHVTAAGYDLDLIGVHLKAGGAPDDGDRRAAAARTLDSYLAAQVASGEDEVILLGDYNEVITSAEGRARLAPLLDADRYRLRTEAAALGGERSFLPTGRVIDHLLTTAGLEQELGSRPAVIPRLDQYVIGYDASLTDHLPVVMTMPAQPPR